MEIQSALNQLTDTASETYPLAATGSLEIAIIAATPPHELKEVIDGIAKEAANLAVMKSDAQRNYDGAGKKSNARTVSEELIQAAGLSLDADANHSKFEPYEKLARSIAKERAVLTKSMRRVAAVLGSLVIGIGSTIGSYEVLRPDIRGAEQPNALGAVLEIDSIPVIGFLGGVLGWVGGEVAVAGLVNRRAHYQAQKKVTKIESSALTDRDCATLVGVVFEPGGLDQ
jgi:hypothetical protein